MASEHTKNSNPANLPKHEKGAARKEADATNSEYQAYRKKGGKLSPKEWLKKGKPKK